MTEEEKQQQIDEMWEEHHSTDPEHEMILREHMREEVYRELKKVDELVWDNVPE